MNQRLLPSFDRRSLIEYRSRELHPSPLWLLHRQICSGCWNRLCFPKRLGEDLPHLLELGFSEACCFEEARYSCPSVDQAAQGGSWESVWREVERLDLVPKAILLEKVGYRR